jgi:hypothetical protein
MDQSSSPTPPPPDDRAEPTPVAPPAASAPAAAPKPLARSERREKAATDALRTLIRDLHMDRFGAVVPAAEEVPLTLALTAQPQQGWDLKFVPPLAEQIGRQVEDAQAGRGLYQAGHAFCFRCESSQCAHAAPPSPLSVFRAYTQTGMAEWQDLHQAFVEARDERVDRLFDERPQVLTRVQLGRDLRDRQLSSFGRSSKTYSILGQVVTGYFLMPRSYAGSDDTRRLAVTFQVVETRASNGELCLRLNTLAGLTEGRDIEDLLTSEWEPWVYRARELAIRALEGIERRARAAQTRQQTDDLHAALRRVPVILRRLAEFLERGYRQGRRRTHHVEDRRQEHRPVHKALDDVREAPLEAFFYDERSAAFVVCGPQGRAHVFNVAGRHVTSFVLKPDSVDFRVRTQRWRPATAEEARDVKQRIQQHGTGEGPPRPSRPSEG